MSELFGIGAGVGVIVEIVDEFPTFELLTAKFPLLEFPVFETPVFPTFPLLELFATGIVGVAVFGMLYQIAPPMPQTPKNPKAAIGNSQINFDLLLFEGV